MRHVNYGVSAFMSLDVACRTSATRRLTVPLPLVVPPPAAVRDCYHRRMPDAADPPRTSATGAAPAGAERTAAGESRAPGGAVETPGAGRSVDINVDAGESFGRWRVADEDAVLAFASSVNLACGFHAGDPANLLAAIRTALRHGLALGAHPGYPDKVGFGRRAMALSHEELSADTIYQLGALGALTRSEGARLCHVKAHGALYQHVMADAGAAAAFARGVAAYDAGLFVYVLAGPGGDTMRCAADAAGLRCVAEGFPDRAYLRSGALAPRQLAGAVLVDVDAIAERAVAFAAGTPVAALDGGTVTLRADTLCLHGDGASAALAVGAVRRAVEASGYLVRAHAPAG